MIDVCFDEMRALLDRELVKTPHDPVLSLMKRIMNDMVYVSISFNLNTCFTQEDEKDIERCLVTRMIYR